MKPGAARSFGSNCCIMPAYISWVIPGTSAYDCTAMVWLLSRGTPHVVPPDSGYTRDKTWDSPKTTQFLLTSWVQAEDEASNLPRPQRPPGVHRPTGYLPTFGEKRRG